MNLFLGNLEFCSILPCRIEEECPVHCLLLQLNTNRFLDLREEFFLHNFCLQCGQMSTGRIISWFSRNLNEASSFVKIWQISPRGGTPFEGFPSNKNSSRTASVAFPNRQTGWLHITSSSFLMTMVMGRILASLSSWVMGKIKDMMGWLLVWYLQCAYEGEGDFLAWRMRKDFWRERTPRKDVPTVTQFSKFLAGRVTISVFNYGDLFCKSATLSGTKKVTFGAFSLILYIKNCRFAIKWLLFFTPADFVTWPVFSVSFWSIEKRKTPPRRHF